MNFSKMYFKFASFFLFLGLLPSMALSQRIEKSGNTLVYKDQNVKYKEAEHIFKEHPLAHQYYKNSIKNYKGAKYLGIASIGAISLGATIIFTAFDSDLAGFGAISMILIGPTLGIVGLLNLPPAISNKRKSIETFNYGKSIGLQRKQGLSISVSKTTNGLGFVLNF